MSPGKECTSRGGQGGGPEAGLVAASQHRLQRVGDRGGGGGRGELGEQGGGGGGDLGDEGEGGGESRELVRVKSI